MDEFSADDLGQVSLWVGYYAQLRLLITYDVSIYPSTRRVSSTIALSVTTVNWCCRVFGRIADRLTVECDNSLDLGTGTYWYIDRIGTADHKHNPASSESLSVAALSLS